MIKYILFGNDARLREILKKYKQVLIYMYNKDNSIIYNDVYLEIIQELNFIELNITVNKMSNRFNIYKRIINLEHMINYIDK